MGANSQVATAGIGAAKPMDNRYLRGQWDVHNVAMGQLHIGLFFHELWRNGGAKKCK
jgi:hypothetical protein